MNKSKLKAILKHRGYRVPRKFELVAYCSGSRFEFIPDGDSYLVYSYRGDKLLYGPRTLDAMRGIEVQNKIAEMGHKWQKKQGFPDK